MATESKKISNKKYAAIGGIVVILLGLYVIFGIYFSSHFLPGTKSYGVDISAKTKDQAAAAIEDKLKDAKLVLKDGKQTLASIKETDLGITKDYPQITKQLLNSQNPWLLQKGDASVEASDNNADEGKLTQFVEGLFPTINDGRTVTKNAEITSDNGKFELVAEVKGNNFSKENVLKTVKESVAKGDFSVQLDQHYETPTVTEKSETLQANYDKLKKLSQAKITYSFSDHNITIPEATLVSWLQSQNGEVVVNESLLKSYIQSLNAQYATVGSDRQFNSTKRGTVTVPGGIYGWSINTAAEVPELKKLVLAGEDTTREPTIQGSGYHKDGTDIGSTYIEVDKVNQHMWYYVDGKVALETDVVTGKKGQETPSAVNNIWKKELNATLKGKNSDGTDYASPVNYWMPIDNTGVGIHDSSWQPKYGGDWWIEHGSHGCINTPPETMAKLYNMVAVGTPVIVF